jgi:hypothetical protein
MYYLLYQVAGILILRQLNSEVNLKVYVMYDGLFRYWFELPELCGSNYSDTDIFA